MDASAPKGVEYAVAKRSVGLEQIWRQKLPDDLPETLECKFCGEPKQLLRVNERVAFWVHLDLKRFRKCKILTFRTSFLQSVLQAYNQLHQALKFHKSGGDKDGGISPENTGPK